MSWAEDGLKLKMGWAEDGLRLDGLGMGWAEG